MLTAMIFEMLILPKMFNVDEHQRSFGNGFYAWTVYEGHCRHQRNQYISNCFPNGIQVIIPSNTEINNNKLIGTIVSNAVGDHGRAYERCELAKELRYRHNIEKYLHLVDPHYRRYEPKMFDTEFREVPGSRGFEYFDTAKDLLGIRELFEQEPATLKKVIRFFSISIAIERC